MKIVSLNIYGYGKIKETVINTNHQLVQIFGENEAGKSTTMSFIHSILFGFPTRKEQEPRREPRMHNLYGGKLVVTFPDEDGHIEIERVKGKVQGDVKVYLPDGTTRGEDWLIKKLNYIDKKTYRSIFSFDVLGLQDIHKNMTEDKLQEYLLRAGALGSHEYDEMMSAIDQELKLIYKKNGINPEVNQELEELRELNGRINKLEETEERYKYLTTEKLKTEESVSAKKNALFQLETIRKQKMKEIMYHKDIKDWKVLEGKLNIAPVVFPEKGIERYERLQNNIKQIHRDLDLRSEKLKTLKHEINAVELPDPKDMNYLSVLQKREPDIKQKNLEVSRLDLNMQNLEDENIQLRQDIGWQKEHEEVDDSNIVKESVQTLLAKFDEVSLEEQYLIREIDHLKSDINQLDQEIIELENAQISDSRVKAKQEVVQREVELKEKEKMFKLIEKEYEREKRERDRVKRGQSALIIGISVITLLISVYYFFTDSLLMGGVFLLVGAIGLIFLFFMNRDHDDSLKMDYEREVKDLQTEIDYMKERTDVDFDLNEARDLKMDLRTLNAKRISFKVKIEELKQTLSVKETHRDQLNTSLLNAKRALKINTEIENKNIIDAIHTIREIKHKRNQINRHMVEKGNLLKALQEFKQEVKADVKDLGIEFYEATIFFDVGQLLEEMKTNKANYHRLDDQIKLIESELSKLQERLNEAEQEVRGLFDYVEAEDEEAFYYYARKYEEYQDNTRRFKTLNDKLEEEHFDYAARNELSNFMLADLKDEEEHINGQIDSFNGKIQDEQQILAELNQEITHLEGDGKLSELNHLFEMKKNIIEELSKEYMSLYYIKLLIETHIKAIKDERLPIVIEEARSIFEYVTKGRYINVVYDDNGITVRHSNGQVFHPLELSQSTKEMLYISLRLSLIKALKSYYQLPIIIDDAFVHFDKERKKIILDYLRNEVSDQVMYFTCNLDSSIASSQTVKLKEKVR
ncbi:ATP-binding protein [Corticicoccus populi]|uniref:AAA family ATPase n=1 Tax=Corticicoccus populi TaxID=1812821 RepID=A0ABW5WSC3_9STAP